MYKNLLADAEGKVSGPATVIAGFGAGATESLLAVTPFESIKTQLYVYIYTHLTHTPLLPPSHALPLPLPLQSDHSSLHLVSTTANPQTHACAASCTAPRSSPKKKAYEASSRVSYPQPRVKLQTQPCASRVTRRLSNWRSHMLPLEKNSVRLAHLGLEDWRASLRCTRLCRLIRSRRGCSR